jgi:hypothetical protein
VPFAGKRKKTNVVAFEPPRREAATALDPRQLADLRRLRARLVADGDEALRRKDLVDDERHAIEVACNILRGDVDDLANLFDGYDALGMGARPRQPYDPDGPLLLHNVMLAASLIGAYATDSPTTRRRAMADLVNKQNAPKRLRSKGVNEVVAAHTLRVRAENPTLKKESAMELIYEPVLEELRARRLLNEKKILGRSGLLKRMVGLWRD